jgi:hypothetical protein
MSIATFDLTNPNGEIIKQKFPLSHSAYQKHGTCGLQYDFYYNKRIEKRYTSTTLLVGRVFDEVFNEYLKSVWYQNNFNLPQFFEEMWFKKFLSVERESSVTTDENKLYATLKHLCNLIPQSFNASGLIPYSTIDGQPCVQHKHTFDIGYGVRVTAIMDLIAYSKILKKPVVVDVKAASATAMASTEFTSVSEQLLIYSLACEKDPRLADTQFNHGAFWQAERKNMPTLLADGITPRKGSSFPTIILPEIAEFSSFHKNQMAHRYIQKQIDINQGRFYGGSRMSYNSPCKLCDYAGLCIKGDVSGLVKRNEYKRNTANAA